MSCFFFSEIHLVETNGSNSWCLQVIPDSLATLSHYLTNMRRDFENIGMFSSIRQNFVIVWQVS